MALRLAPGELTEQGRQPPWLGLLNWFDAVSSPGPSGCQPSLLQKGLGQHSPQQQQA